MGIETGSIEISNLDLDLDHDQHMTAWKEQIKIARKTVIDIAQWALANYPSLKKVIIMKTIPRYDDTVRAELTKYGNFVFDQLFQERGCPTNIVIGEHNLDCYGNLRVLRYGEPNSQVGDGIHLRGKLGEAHFTTAVLNTFKQSFPFLQSLSLGNNRNYPSSPRVNPAPLQQREGRSVRRSQPSQSTTRYNFPTSKPKVNPWQPFVLPLYNRFAGLTNF